MTAGVFLSPPCSLKADMWSDLKAGSCSEELLKWWLMGKHLCCPGGQLLCRAKESSGYFRSPLSVSLPPKIKSHVGCDHRLFIIMASHRLTLLQGRAQNINQTINQSQVLVLCREADVAERWHQCSCLCLCATNTNNRYWILIFPICRPSRACCAGSEPLCPEPHCSSVENHSH